MYVIVRRDTCQSTLTTCYLRSTSEPPCANCFSVSAFSSLHPRSSQPSNMTLVLEGGRVMDPETGLDAARNVGIRDGKIASISTSPLSGRRMIHAAGLVVAPGFIDLHQHGQDLASQRVKAFDGVTTALEMEIGAPDVAQFLKSKQGQSTHSLRHNRQPCGGAIARLRRTPARRNDPAEKRTRHGPTRYARTNRAHSAAPARRNRRGSSRHRHGH